jgi:hypothetical protein
MICFKDPKNKLPLYPQDLRVSPSLPMSVFKKYFLFIFPGLFTRDSLRSFDQAAAYLLAKKSGHHERQERRTWMTGSKLYAVSAFGDCRKGGAFQELVESVIYGEYDNCRAC